MKFDWVIVGAGFTGATFAERIASQRNETVLLVDQRDHVGGNAWDEYNKHDILEHKYGPHIFHTNSKEVWDYLSKFTEWRPYFHKVLCSVDGQLIPLPFNLNSIEKVFTPDIARRLSHKLIKTYGFGNRVPILKLLEATDEDLRFIANYAYKKVFEQYTFKQWGMKPEELSRSVTARVPILISRDDRYFQDTYQAMPKNGYSSMFRRMLAHKNIRILLNTRWQEISGQVKFNRMVFTGAIDEFFQYKHGELPYRSLRFDVQTHPVGQYQPAAVINYPNEYDYTRITEQKWLTAQNNSHTTVLIEYPIKHVNSVTTPYYPIPTDANRELYRLYQNEAASLTENVIFAGRLADYMYYNMDQAVARALKLSKELDHAQ